MKAPREFAEEVDRANREGRFGDLDAFASELRELDLPWALGGLLLVGEAQFKGKAWDAAAQTWEAIRDTNPDHHLANQRLATIYQKRTMMPAGAPAPEEPAAVIVFSGHRLDAENRVQEGKEPRFPASAEQKARKLIRDAVEKVKASAGGPVIGYAGGASGGDILFHEVCDELGIETHLFLAGPYEKYVTASVQDAGGAWVERFHRIRRARPESTRQLTDDLTLPRWLVAVPDFSIWEHNNIWLLHNALAHGGDRVVLLALWNRAEGDGPGGTKQMVEEAEKRGARTKILDARPLKDG